MSAGTPKDRSKQARPTHPRGLYGSPRVFLLLASFLSGAAALAYELFWVRELALLAGSTQAAISVVLSVYFLGLASGSYIAGRIVRRVRWPLLLYAVVELVIGIWALLFHPLLDGMGQFYSSLYAGLPVGSALIHMLRIASAVGLLLLPATCMGATLPLLAQFGADDLRGAPRWSALLYGVNTLGAMAGTWITGFYVIEHFGIANPLRTTGLLNLICAVAVSPWMRQRTLGARTEDNAPGKISHFGLMLLLSFGVLGFCNIAIEVLWTNFYSLIFPNDTYVYSTLLLMFLFGVGAGSLAGQHFTANIKRGVYALGLLQLISAAVSIGMTYYVPPLVLGAAQQSTSFGQQLRGYFMGIGAGTLIPTLCMGISFPLLVRIVLAHPEQTGGIVGRALAWNTLGGVLGSAVAGFVFLEVFGLQTGLFITAGLTAVVGLALCMHERDLPNALWTPVALLCLPLLFALFGRPPRLPEALFEMHFPVWPKTEILETRPSVHGTVAITQQQDVRRVWINSTWVASSRAHLAFGYAPWLLHPEPVRSALGICCGTGRTFGALYNAGIQDLDLVDINPAVIALSSKWLAEANHGVLANPDVRVIIDDGRHFVRYGKKQYDLITLEPLQMFQKGVAYFYTQEFYSEARQRLSPGGVICQWMPLYLMDPHEFASMVKTFVSVYPNSLLWGRRGHSLVLLGYNADGVAPAFNESRIYARMMRRTVREDLAQEELLGQYDPLIYTLIDGNGLRELGRSGEIYTDDRPTLEFTAPRAHNTPDQNLARVAQYLTPLTALFDLPDPDLARDLERLRQLTLQVSFTGADKQTLMPMINEVRYRVYAGDDSMLFVPGGRR